MQEEKIYFGNCVGVLGKYSEKGIIFYSGFFGDKDESDGLFKDFVPYLHKNDFSTLRFDLSGLGESKEDLEKITINNWINDSYSALEVFCEKANLKQVGIVGFSLGATYSILNYPKNSKIKGIALWAPALNPQKDMLERYKQNGDYQKAKNKELFKSGKKVPYHILDDLNFNVFDELEKIDCPVLICHSKEDPYIPFSTSNQSQKKIKNLKELIALENCGHSFKNTKYCNGNQRKKVYEKTLNFFNEVFIE